MLTQLATSFVLFHGAPDEVKAHASRSPHVFKLGLVSIAQCLW